VFCLLVKAPETSLEFLRKFLSEFTKQIKWLQNSKGIVMSSVNGQQKKIPDKILNFIFLDTKADGSGIPFKKKTAW